MTERMLVVMFELWLVIPERMLVAIFELWVVMTERMILGKQDNSNELNCLSE